MKTTRAEERPILLGLLGDERIRRSPSPRMHALALKCVRKKGWYVPFEPGGADLGDLLVTFDNLGFLGFNVTAPLKEAVKPYLARLTPAARIIGAVNTLVRLPENPGGSDRYRGYLGDNTDHLGFAEAYLNDITPREALVLGAGGAARAVIHALSKRGFVPSVAARDGKKSEILSREFGIEALDYENIRRPFGLVVNATGASGLKELTPPPGGLVIVGGGDPRDPERPVPAKVIDLNYGRKDNFFMKLARDSGTLFEDGLLMLAHQARYSFEAWLNATGSPTYAPLAPFLKGVGLKRSPENASAKNPRGRGGFPKK
ncbi:MAG: shikimate dehydrogenase [Deltaproteobacteria bacterium]|jgi:shikimate dehydrogenase|nr:shikimate dehydrogenase [Deltaproteobacteria bacterium]